MWFLCYVRHPASFEFFVPLPLAYTGYHNVCAQLCVRMLEIVPFSPPHFVCNSVMPTYFFGYTLSYVSIPGLASAHSTEAYRLWLHGVHVHVCALCIFECVCVHACMSFLCLVHLLCMCLAWSFIPFGGEACALTKTLIATCTCACMHVRHLEEPCALSLARGHPRQADLWRGFKTKHGSNRLHGQKICGFTTPTYMYLGKLFSGVASSMVQLTSSVADVGVWQADIPAVTSFGLVTLT